MDQKVVIAGSLTTVLFLLLIIGFRVIDARAESDSTYYLPVVLGQIGSVDPSLTPTSTPLATIETSTPTPTPASCPVVENLLSNGGFEGGQESWQLYTNGSVDLTIDNDAYECKFAAKLSIDNTGNNTQLFQTGFLLRDSIRYRLVFSAYSSTGDDLLVAIQQHQAPYTNYGLSQKFSLDTSWQTYSVEFVSTGVNIMSKDTRIRFWFPGLASDGEVYWIDNVRLIEIGSAPTRTPSGTNTPGPVPTNTRAPESTVTPGPTSTPNLTATPGSGGGQELLVFNLDRAVTEGDRGFPHDQPPKNNFDWTKPINYAAGTLHYRVEIRSQPKAKDMRLQFCFWQEKDGYKFELENCGPQQNVRGTPGTVATWSVPVKNMWKKDGNSIEWWRPRFRDGMAIKNKDGNPVSDYNGWNWYGEDPKEWYPIDMFFKVVVVAPGVEFSGWENYED